VYSVLQFLGYRVNLFLGYSVIPFLGFCVTRGIQTHTAKGERDIFLAILPIIDGESELRNYNFAGFSISV
jgi:hypothetical protein